MNPTNRERLNSLTAQKQQLAGQLDGLKSQRAEALMAGGKFTKTARIIELADELGAIDDALVLAERLADQDDARARAAWQADQKEAVATAIRAKVKSFVDKTAEVESLANSLAAGLSTLNSISSEMNDLAMSVSEEKHIAHLQVTNVIMRISGRLGRALSKIDGVPAGVYGQFQWTPEHVRDEDWAAEEHAAFEHIFAHIFRNIEASVADLRSKASAA